MGKPTDEQLSAALAEAGRMREQGEDPHYVAKALLNLSYRMHYLEKVLHAARVYLNSGQATTEHAQLLKAIDEALKAEAHSAGTDREDYGLTDPAED